MYKGPLASWLSAALFSAVLILPLPTRLVAQATSTASKQASVSIFGAYSRVTPDYSPYKNDGAMFGFDYTRYPRWFVTPSFEFRGKVAPGPVVGQKTFGGGLRLERQLRSFHPYADFLVSAGTFSYTHPTIDTRGNLYKSDNSIVYSTGVGLDYDVTPQWAGLVDYQFEHWSLGTNQTFTPRALSIGIMYRIPFRSYQH